jgi:hypothetical protein
MRDDFIDDAAIADWEPGFEHSEAALSAVFVGPEDARKQAYGDDPRAILAGEALRFGFKPEPDVAAGLKELYPELLRHGMPAAQRWQALKCVERWVISGKAIDAGAYIAFMLEDPHRSIVARAAYSYASDGSLDSGDPMTRPKLMVGFLEHGVAKNAGAIFGALLSMGDRRVCDLIRPIRDTLSDDEVNEASLTTSAFLHAETIIFILDWLETLEGSDQDRVFGSLVSSLILRRRHMKTPRVATGLRPFPYASVSDDEAIAMLGLIPVEHFIARIRGRMIALAETEPEPRLMPGALKAWGLGREDLWNEWSDMVEPN